MKGEIAKNREEIKNLKKAASRIIRAIKNKEKIILYGDADLDGVTSVIILKETLQNIEGLVSAVYFPDREQEGYGINEKALNYIEKFTPALLLVLDCGISNFDEVLLAKRLGFEVIIIDHHEVLDNLPKANIVIDPKQKEDSYHFKELATVGITYKLSQILLGEKLSAGLNDSFLELVALATIADMMPERDENKTFIEKGLNSLRNTWRPGLKVFFEIGLLEKNNLDRSSIQKVISVLNAMTVKDHLNETYLLLISSSIKEAKKISQGLVEKSRQKQSTIREIVEDINERVLGKQEELIILEGDVDWPLVLMGSAASRICNQHKKPTFIFKKQQTESRGAVRMPPMQNSIEAMKSCSRLLKTYGGHPLAAGFTIKNENLERFKECLIEYFNRKSAQI